MADWLSSIHQEQADLSKKIAAALYQELVPQLQERPGVIAAFVPSITPQVIAHADEEALSALLQAELDGDVYKAFHYYTEWVAVGIIRWQSVVLRIPSRPWMPRPLPIPHAIDAARFCISVEVEPLILAYTIDHMRTLGKLPLLGTVKNGKLIPDRILLTRWKDLFDWSEESTTRFTST